MMSTILQSSRLEGLLCSRSNLRMFARNQVLLFNVPSELTNWPWISCVRFLEILRIFLYLGIAKTRIFYINVFPVQKDELLYSLLLLRHYEGLNPIYWWQSFKMYFPYDINFVYVVFRWILLALSSLFDQYLSKHWLDEFFRRLLVKTSATRLSCIGFRSFALDSNRSCWLSLSKVRC